MAEQQCAADLLEDLAHRVHVLVFDLREPARSHAEVERRVDEGRTIAREIDGLFRART